MDYIKLDYNLSTPEERTSLVQEIIKTTPPERLTPKYLEILSDYIVFAMDKEEKKKKEILTDNRLVTINKREISYQGLASKFENGEDGLYNLINTDKNIILTPNVSITDEDLAAIPDLKILKDSIKEIEKAEAAASGKKKFLLKKQLIQMRQDQYVIKNAYNQPIYPTNIVKTLSSIDLNENITINENQEPESDGLITLFNPAHISALLCNYSSLKEETWGKFHDNIFYLMEDLDKLIESALKEDFPLYYSLVFYKIDGKQNVEIQDLLEQEHGIRHSIQYISSLWQNKIPKLLAEKAKENYLVWYYTNVEYGKWKRCSRCGEIKLAHNRFFSKNSTSKDGWYSICKKCRNSKSKIKKVPLPKSK